MNLLDHLENMVITLAFPFWEIQKGCVNTAKNVATLGGGAF